MVPSSLRVPIVDVPGVWEDFGEVLEDFLRSVLGETKKKVVLSVYPHPLNPPPKIRVY